MATLHFKERHRVFTAERVSVGTDLFLRGGNIVRIPAGNWIIYLDGNYYDHLTDAEFVRDYLPADEDTFLYMVHNDFIGVH